MTTFESQRARNIMVHVSQELGKIHTTDLTNIGYANQQKQKEGLGEQPRLMPAPRSGSDTSRKRNSSLRTARVLNAAR